MQKWAKLVRRICGYFWTTVWKDTWLIQLLGKFFQHVSGQVLQDRLLQIDNQLHVAYTVQPDKWHPVRILVDAQTQSSAVIPITQFVIGSSSIGQTVQGTKYSTLQQLGIPVKIQNKVDTPDILLNIDTDYTVQDGCIKFNQPLDQIGFRSTIVTVAGQIKVCYQLWGIYQKYQTLRDAFTGILQVPNYWLYKYPGAVEAAWSIKLNGSNKRDVLRLLGAVGQCPVAWQQGTVSDVQDSTVIIGDHTYTGEGSPIVTKGQYVLKGQPLFVASENALDYPRVITWKDTIPSDIASIPVVTDAGVLTASNRDGLSPVNNVLPLTGQNYIQYQRLCAQLNADLNIPYIQLPDNMNPAQFLLSTVWKHSGFIIVAPSSNYKDMCIAARVIVQNTALGAIPIIYRYAAQTYVTIQPDLQVTSKAIAYYNESVNNGLQHKERYNDFDK